MLEISSKTNLLEKKSYKYSLQDVTEPFAAVPFTSPPRIPAGL